jgi:serine phosphatase RsbU (regulator of sigma subunit)
VDFALLPLDHFTFATSILEGVMHDVLDFRGPAPQKDDLTLVVLKPAP